MCLDWYIIFLLLCLSAHSSFSYSLAESYGMKYRDGSEYTPEAMTAQDLEIVDRQQASGKAGPLKALNVMRKKNAKTVDASGNIVLNGRVNTPADFTVHTRRLNENYTNTPPSHYFNVIFCKDNRTRHCDQNGLVLCWQKDPYVQYGVRNTSHPRVKHVVDTCGDDMAGIGVSTEGRNTKEVFRVDTSWGNTYKFRMPNYKCFTFWIMHWAFDNRTYALNRTGGGGEGVVGITYFGSATAFDQGYAQDYWDTSYVEKKDPNIQVKEAICKKDTDTQERTCNFEEDNFVGEQVKVKLDEMLHTTRKIRATQLHSVSKFRAVGGGPCCHLKAKLLGRRISKCYFQWKPLRKSCDDVCQPQIRPCEHWINIGVSERLPYGDRKGRPDKYDAKMGLMLKQKFGAYLAWEILPEVLAKVIDGMLTEIRHMDVITLSQEEKDRLLSPIIHMMLDSEKIDKMFADNCSRINNKEIPQELREILEKRGEEGLKAIQKYKLADWPIQEQMLEEVKARQNLIIIGIETKVLQHYRYSKKNCKTGQLEWVADVYDTPVGRYRVDQNGKHGEADVAVWGGSIDTHKPDVPGPHDRLLEGEGSENDSEVFEKFDDITMTQLSLITDSIVRELEDLIEESFDVLDNLTKLRKDHTLDILTQPNDYVGEKLGEKIRCDADPYTKEARQLVYICQGIETDTAITEIFSNYPDHLAKVEAREKELGYPADPGDTICE